MIRQTLIILGIILFVTACDSSDDMDLVLNDRLIIGSFYGFCAGEECVEIYLREENRWYEDQNDSYPEFDSFYEGDFVRLSATIEEKLNRMDFEVPDYLFRSDTVVFGIPDAYDQGGLYIERETEEYRQFWILDQNRSTLAQEIREFHLQVNAAIDTIQKYN